MRCVVQRVSRAQVSVDGIIVGNIGAGLVALIGAEAGDTRDDMLYCADKMVGLRVFDDDAGKMNLSIRETGGAILLISQFTLMGDARRGRRPSFSRAARPEDAEPMLHQMAEYIAAAGITVESGRFQAHMEVELVNDGPVTILLDSKKTF
jgi:D-tyrosyl-tRNA(Tyr) deacylase